MSNEQISYWLHLTYRAIMLPVKMILLLPAALFKNVLALILGIIGCIPLMNLLIDATFGLVHDCFVFVVLAFSLCSKIPFVGWLFTFVGIPVAMIYTIVLEILPSFARLADTSDPKAHLTWHRQIIADSYPFSIEFSPYGKRFKKRKVAERILSFLDTPPMGKFIPEDYFYGFEK